MTREELNRLESSMKAVHVARDDRGLWRMPEIGDGDVLLHLPKQGDVNDHYEMRISGVWYSRWPGFSWEVAHRHNSWIVDGYQDVSLVISDR